MISKINSYAHETYNIEYWSDGFFSIDNDGYVVLGDKLSSLGANIRLDDIIQQAKQTVPDLELPLLIRFPDILSKRLQDLTQAFELAFDQYEYQGKYLPAYPIKVNQQKSVITSLLNNKNKIALEAGSKPELFIITALAAKYNCEIICNGYKDKDYIKLALLGTKLGLKVNIIIEKLSELDLILAQAQELNVVPRLGVRVRLSSLGKGYWQNSGGVRSKFGLTSLQLLNFIEKLKASNNLGTLKVLHFHMGSQIADLSDIKTGLREGCRLYAETVRAGASLEAIDVGGGLGVDYEGTNSRSYCSINYNLNSYAELIVSTIGDICAQENLKHPAIITESGRAMVAHHAVLVTDIIDSESLIPEQASIDHNINNNSSIINELNNLDNKLINNPRASVEIYNQAKQLYDQAQDLYISGHVHLPERAQIEQVYYKICFKLIKTLNPLVNTHRKLLECLNEDMANKIFCNFSLFQSMPDVWGLNQVFPVLPLSDLDKIDQNNYMRGIIQDMTCDSDGRIKQYIDGQGVDNSLPMPKLNKDKKYNLGFFMVGAYQEILGDLHNLFGDTASIDVKLNNNDFVINNIKQGDIISKVIEHVDFNSDDLINNIKANIADKPKDSKSEYSDIIDFINQYLNKTPYFS